MTVKDRQYSSTFGIVPFSVEEGKSGRKALFFLGNAVPHEPIFGETTTSGDYNRRSENNGER
jgi:hypothetical protein